MNYVLNLFSPETWRAFQDAGSQITGFSKHQRSQAERTIQSGDLFLCYVTRLGRWCGALRVLSPAFVDETPLFKAQNDPFVVRFRVEPLVLLQAEHGLPVNLPHIWNALTWTRDIQQGSVGWGANFQRSLRVMPEKDGEFLLNLLKEQHERPTLYPLSDNDVRELRKVSKVRTPTGEVGVEIPDEDDDDAPAANLDGTISTSEVRQSHKVQALLALIGTKMGFRVWLPRGDRSRVAPEIPDDASSDLIEILPLNYDDATLQTIEQIDVLWLRGRTIVRAFEVEHTTAIYSGLLRMADLLALAPNLNIPLHIVAPRERTERVLREIRRPIFSLLEFGPLADRCTLIPYDEIERLAKNPGLTHLRDTILEESVITADL